MRRPQRDSARSARLEAVRRQQRRNAHPRTAVLVAASIVWSGSSPVRRAQEWVPPGMPSRKDEFWRSTPTATES